MSPLVAAWLVLTPFVANDRGTLAVDPVELLAGRDVPGLEELSVSHAGYRYLFVNEENRSAFAADPETYEIQMGGACARMGPLSGTGSAKIYAVHDGRIYIFASEACREGFLEAPDRLLDRDDPVPESNEQTRALGRELLARAVEAAGGAERVDAVASLHEKWEGTVEAGGREYRRVEAHTYVFPATYRYDSAWDADGYGHVVTAEDAFFIDGAGARVMHPQQRAAAERGVRRHPLVILRARNRPGFLAVAAGRGAVGDAEVDLVTVAFDGATTTLGLDVETGRLASLSYRGRGPSARLGTIERVFTEYRAFEGLTLPVKSTARFDGSDEPKLAHAWTTVEVGRSYPDDWFRRRD